MYHAELPPPPPPLPPVLPNSGMKGAWPLVGVGVGVGVGVWADAMTAGIAKVAAKSVRGLMSNSFNIKWDSSV